MSKLPKEERLKETIKKGVALLKAEKGYSQSSLVKKMGTLGFVVSTSSLSNILKDKDAGLQALQTASKGILEIVGMELGMEYNEKARDFQKSSKPDWEPSVISEDNPFDANPKGFILHTEGRLTIQQKTTFITSARQEVIEVGIRLKTFSEYFTSRNEKEYKAHIIALLQKGVTVKGYLIDPESILARLYFEDRAKVQPSELDALSETKKVVERLKNLVKEMEQMSLPGSFEIYLYRHIPYNHFLAVDINTPKGKMMVSHYIYGVRRAHCPVLEFTKDSHPLLFRKYTDSLQSYLRDAQRLQ